MLRNHIRSAPSDTGLVRRFLLLLAQRNHLVAALGLRLVEAERARDLCAADALAVRNYLRQVETERDGLARENRGLRRVLDGMQTHVDETNHENRVLRDRLDTAHAEVEGRDRRIAALESALAERDRSGGRRRRAP